MKWNYDWFARLRRELGSWSVCFLLEYVTMCELFYKFHRNARLNFAVSLQHVSSTPHSRCSNLVKCQAFKTKSKQNRLRARKKRIPSKQNLKSLFWLGLIDKPFNFHWFEEIHWEAILQIVCLFSSIHQNSFKFLALELVFRLCVD